MCLRSVLFVQVFIFHVLAKLCLFWSWPTGCACVTHLCPVAQRMGRAGALQKHRDEQFGGFSELNHLAQESDRQGERKAVGIVD